MSGQPLPGPSDYDAELQLHDEVLRRAYDVQPWHHVLDIGCGTGQTTREAARVAQTGSASGVDIRASAIERAREFAQQQGVRNVTFECADAQVHHFPQERFDLVISRFGTMFFADPVAAFANIRLALCPAGRLVMAVWQASERNEWDVAIRQALAGPKVPSAGLEPFSLADPPTTTAILDAAGFADVTITDLSEPVYYGPDLPAALAWVQGFRYVGDALGRLNPAAVAHALERLRDVLSAHMSDTGIWFGSRAWIVTARRQ
jgi:SAM-dependent methyltransferase